MIFKFNYFWSKYIAPEILNSNRVHNSTLCSKDINTQPFVRLLSENNKKKTHRPKVFVVFVLIWQQNSLNRNVITAYYVYCAINGITFHVQVLQRSNLTIITFPGLAHSAHQLTSPLILGRISVAKYYNIITENEINENV